MKIKWRVNIQKQFRLIINSMHIAYLSIGSNIGEKRKNLDDAIALLDKDNKIDVVEVSSFYKTQPQNYTDQEWFVNAALKIKTQLKPEKLLLTKKPWKKSWIKPGNLLDLDQELLIWILFIMMI